MCPAANSRVSAASASRERRAIGDRGRQRPLGSAFTQLGHRTALLPSVQTCFYANGENIMAYVDGFVAAVPTANREIYKKHAEAAAVVFKEHGAMKLVECWGDDVPDGKLTSFPMAVKRKDDETVVFSWIIWPSRKVRDEGMKKVTRLGGRQRPRPDAENFGGEVSF